MPFTLSHSAAVAPFWPLVRRHSLPLCALAVGTLSPDLEYLARLSAEWRWSHSPLGVLYFCLPVGLVALALWVGLLRGPIRELLALPPARLQVSARWWLRAGVAIVVGAATHLVWDGFTHGFSWATQLIPGLRASIGVGGVRIPWFNILQHVSTVVGGAVVLGWFLHEIGTGRPRALLTPWRIAVFGSVSAVAAAVAAWNAARWGRASDYWTLQVQIGRAAVGALLGLGVALVAYAVAHRLRAPRSELAQPPHWEEP